MKIYLMRHGETDYNKNKMIQGQCDIELNEYGRELARITAEGLKEVPLDVVYTSPLIRAKETAQIVIGDRKVLWIEEPRIQEICFGEYEGKHCGRKKESKPRAITESHSRRAPQIIIYRHMVYTLYGAFHIL